ncbi:MAG: hypothetical protein M3R55_02650 [Acidobacteriota bacterium]|nr:hypothetical protein [Acidobacteriota bacterium]
MEQSRALEHIAEIHARMARADVYRGWRPVPVAASGLVGLAAAALQPQSLLTDPFRFVSYWAAVAAAGMLVGSAEIVWQYVRAPEGYERRRTREVFEQFLPALAAAAIVTLALMRWSLTLVPLLPGLWAVFFGVGIFAARPYLPRACTLVALYYWTAGLVILWIGPSADALSPWWVGLTFGPGQLLAAVAAYYEEIKVARR